MLFMHPVCRGVMFGMCVRLEGFTVIKIISRFVYLLYIYVHERILCRT